MKISVITPSFNQAKFLEECLLSVKEQSCPAFEHIVVDGASSDGSVEILKRYSAMPGWEHLKWISEPDRGQSDALNKGFRMAQGDWIGWLNSDDAYVPGCFQTVVSAAAQWQDASVLYGDYLWIDENSRLLQVRREIEFSRFVMLFNRINLVPSSGALFLHKRIFDDGNFIDESLHYAMDYELYLRLSKRGYRFQHVKKVFGRFRWHAASKTVAHKSDQAFEVEKVRRHYAFGGRCKDGAILPSAALAVARAAATGLRWTEKLVRGYYLDQLWPERAWQRAQCSGSRHS